MYSRSIMHDPSYAWDRYCATMDEAAEEEMACCDKIAGAVAEIDGLTDDEAADLAEAITFDHKNKEVIFPESYTPSGRARSTARNIFHDGLTASNMAEYDLGHVQS
jgi:hypothetical protein